MSAYLRVVGLICLCCAGLLLVRQIANEGSTTAVLLLGVVIAGRTSGLRPALAAAILASIFYLYFFLPPVGFEVADFNDLIALIIFFVVAAVAGGLTGSLRRAKKQRDHFERLYWGAYGSTQSNSAARKPEVESGSDHVSPG